MQTTGIILTEHMKCLDVISRNIQFVEMMPGFIGKNIGLCKVIFLRRLLRFIATSCSEMRISAIFIFDSF